MPSFSRSGEFYGASSVTGPSSALVRIRFAPEHNDVPAVSVLVADKHHANPPISDVVQSVCDAIQFANDEFGTQLVPAEIEYQCDNDGRSRLIGRCAYLIVQRLAKLGDGDFVGVV